MPGSDCNCPGGHDHTVHFWGAKGESGDLCPGKLVQSECLSESGAHRPTAMLCRTASSDKFHSRFEANAECWDEGGCVIGGVVLQRGIFKEKDQNDILGVPKSTGAS